MCSSLNHLHQFMRMIIIYVVDSRLINNKHYINYIGTWYNNNTCIKFYKYLLYSYLLLILNLPDIKTILKLDYLSPSRYPLIYHLVFSQFMV